MGIACASVGNDAPTQIALNCISAFQAGAGCEHDRQEQTYIDRSIQVWQPLPGSSKFEEAQEFRQNGG